MTSVGCDVERREPSRSFAGIVYRCSHYGEQSVWRFLQKLKTQPPYDPAIPLLLYSYVQGKLKQDVKKIICTPTLLLWQAFATANKYMEKT